MHLYRRVEAPVTNRSSTNIRIIVFAIVTTLYTAFLYHSGGAGNFLGGQLSSESIDPMLTAKANVIGRRILSVATWNVAAINNNPFEYWITYKEDPEYENIMTKIESFIETPGAQDVKVEEVFTNQMFTDLEKRMNALGWQSVRSYWETDYRDRKIISGFMKDTALGKKRLASMPDRITNTIHVKNSEDPVCRPTVINMYEGDLGSMQKWWKQWETFMFESSLLLPSTEDKTKRTPYQLLQPIKKAKYPAITDEEEKVSLPLQTMCVAIFDAILVHMMNTVTSPSVWQALKKTMVQSLIKQKVPNTLRLLETVYSNSDIITLQEVSSSLINQATNGSLGKQFWITAPADMDGARDQNSVIMLHKDTFPNGPTMEITSKIYSSFPKGVDIPVEKGDIVALTATDKVGVRYVIASFHGDTNGLATIPVSDAILKTMATDESLLDHKLIFGLDANTYENALDNQQQDVLKWGISYTSHGLTSCWGDVPQKSNYTTYNARTYLQPQLNKACKSTEKREKGDVNPKDFIIFKKKDFKIMQTWKDNTGERRFIEDMAFPTLDFPSDHGILATILEFEN